jgi:ABC-type dipeptide/oligopeptide/nickel transport system permease component
MLRFLIKRLVGLLFVLIGVSFITFIMGYLAPGDPIRDLVGQRADPVTYARLAHAYGLDLPWYQQYFNFLGRLAQGNLGLSLQIINRPVWEILKNGVPVSLELGLLGVSVQILIGIPLGVIAALRSGTWMDTLSMGTALILFALPGFVMAVLFQLFIVFMHISVGSNWPIAGWGNAWQYSWSDIQFKLGPVLIFAHTGMAFYARLTRTSILEVLRQDYIRTARAKGLRERLVVTRHTLRNAMIPIITAAGVALGFLVTGAFFTETIFNIPGIGYTALQSITTRDYPVIQAVAVMLATAVVLGNLLSDILYTIFDPRIKAA